MIILEVNEWVTFIDILSLVTSILIFYLWWLPYWYFIYGDFHIDVLSMVTSILIFYLWWLLYWYFIYGDFHIDILSMVTSILIFYLWWLPKWFVVDVEYLTIKNIYIYVFVYQKVLIRTYHTSILTTQYPLYNRKL